jgi:hypothetical protein
MAKKSNRRSPTANRTNRAPKKKTVLDWKEHFLDIFRLTANISAACKAVGISRDTFYRRRDSDKAFAEELIEAREDAIEALEFEARRRAMDRSDLLLMFLLKAHRPELYRDKFEVKHAGSIGIDPTGELAKRLLADAIACDLACQLAERMIPARTGEEPCKPG